MNQFKNYLDPRITKLAGELSDLGIALSLIGGTVRDFYLGLSSQHDYDCEVRPLKANELGIHDIFEQAKSFLSEKYKLEELRFGVVRISLEELTIELTPPRLESYTKDINHSNFNILFIEDKDFSQGVLRRDFTINSISMVFANGDWELRDPLNGVKDIRDRVLRPCSESFFKDPVRQLRALRFSLKLDFDLKLNLFAGFELKHFSAHYIQYEAKKSLYPMKFITIFYKHFFDLGDYNFQTESIDLDYFSFESLESQTKILEALGRSTKKAIVLHEIKFFELSKMKDEDLFTHIRSKKIDLCIKKIQSLSDEVFSYFEKSGRVDISKSRLQEILSQKVETDGAWEKRDYSIWHLVQKIKKA